MIPRSADKEISLLGIGAQEEFRREQLVNFLRFWRVIIPLSLGVLLIAFVAADLFLANVKRSLGSQALMLKPSEIAALESFENEAKHFNKSVTYLQTVLGSLRPKQIILQKVVQIADSAGIALNRLYMQSANAPITLNGEAKTEDQILNFKKSLEEDVSFANLQLPLTEIKSGPTGLSFSMSFTLK